MTLGLPCNGCQDALVSCCRSNLNDGPVSNQCACSVSIRQWTAHDEMIVAMHEYAYHVISCGSFDAETRGSGTG